jgi:hypothetical protein
MYLFVMGLPGRFSEWCERFTVRLAERALGPTTTFPANSLEELALGAIRSRASRAVVTSRQPGGLLREALVGADHRFVVAYDDPRTALVDLVLWQRVALPDAVQALASSCAALEPLVGAPGALVLQRNGNEARPAIAAAIAAHLEIDADAAAIAGVVSELASESAGDPSDVAAWWGGLAAAEREMTTGALAPYVDESPGDADPLSLLWTGALFFRGDRPGERMIEGVDITGRAHCLVHGPYIVLPVGSWSLSLNLRFTGEAAEHAFSAEVWTDKVLASALIQPEREGETAFALDFAIDGSTDQPVAIRISSMRAAFDGVIGVVGAALTRDASAEKEAAPDTE